MKKLINTNKKASFEYFIIETFEAGIVLVGSEVKAIRDKSCQIAESYIQIKNNDRVRAGDTYTADLYTFWDKDFIVKVGDKVKAADNTVYHVKSIDDLVHYNVCYHLVLERVI